MVYIKDETVFDIINIVILSFEFKYVFVTHLLFGLFQNPEGVREF